MQGPTDSLAEIAYDTFVDANINHQSGLTYPPYIDLPPYVKEAWIKVCDKILEEIDQLLPNDSIEQQIECELDSAANQTRIEIMSIISRNKKHKRNAD